MRLMRVQTGWTWVLGAVFLASVASAIGSVGCVGGSKGLSADDKERLKAYVLDSAPADMQHKTDVNFENKVHLVGYKFDPETAKPGQEVKITMWWRCDSSLDDGWSLFTHLHDDVSDKNDNLDTNGPIRENRNNKQILGPDKWEKGKVYVDDQSYKMPDWVKGPDLTVYTGIWKGDARLRIITGPNDGDNRAIVGKIHTGLVAQAPEQHTENVPATTVLKLAAADKAPVIDGKGDDVIWQKAANLGPFVDVGTGKPNPSSLVNGSAKLLWDDQNVYVLFDVKEDNVVGGFTKAGAADQKGMWTTTGQPKLWTKDTVEIMTDPDPSGDNKNYYELQISPQNKVFHAQFDDYNAPKTEPDGPFGHEEWDPKLKSAVVVKGDIDKPGTDQGYTVEAQIPWAAFDKAVNHPPKSGDVWRMNFYAMKNNGGVGWSPILGQGNFHKATRFGKVSWIDPSAAPPPAPAASGSVTTSAAQVRPGPGMLHRAPMLAPRAPPPPAHP
jgi:Carbohydrate family 9 binding domain-like